MRLPWLACTVSHSFFDYFMVPISFMACPAEGLGLAWRWALLFSPPFFLLPSSTIPLYYSCCEVVCLNLVGLLWACHLFFSQWPSMAIGFFITSLVGSCVPFVFPWVSWVRLPSLGFFGPFLNFAFPWAFIEFFGLPLPNYIIPHPWGSWICHQPLTFFAFITLGLSGLFSLFHIIYCPWFAFSLFLNSFNPIYILKARLFISWACDPLFPLLGLNEFSIYLPTLFYPCC